MKETLFICTNDYEHGQQSKLIGVKKTRKEWKDWAMNDREQLEDFSGREWLNLATDSEIISRICWLYNIKIVEVEK